MGVFAGPETNWCSLTDAGRTHIATKGIVQSGLFLNLDAGSSSSYPGSGTTWYDISGNNRNATLVNSPTYSTSNGGLFTFNGTNNYVTLGNISSISTTQLSSSVWLYDTDTSGGYRHVMSKYGHFLFRIDNNAEGGNLSAFIFIGGNPEPRLSTSWTKNIWTNVAYTWNSNGNFKLYVNGVLKNSVSIRSGTSNTSSYDFTIGSDRQSSYWKGNISQAVLYNRELSETEIQQNFNALRGRYGV